MAERFCGGQVELDVVAAQRFLRGPPSLVVELPVAHQAQLPGPFIEVNHVPMGVDHRSAQGHQLDDALQHLRDGDPRPLGRHPLAALDHPVRQPGPDRNTYGQTQCRQDPGQQQRREHTHNENPTNLVNAALAERGQNRTSHIMGHRYSAAVHGMFG